MADFAASSPTSYASDFRDGLNLKSVSSILFLYFACIAPAITFGAIYAADTANHIGTMELLVGTAVCGLLFAVFSGQPLVILGGTGPLLIFTIILFDLCQPDAFDLPFLETRAWVGIWGGLIVVVMALTDASCLIRYFTRFTDEIFSVLISLIFIYKAVEHIGHGLLDIDSTHTLAMGLVEADSRTGNVWNRDQPIEAAVQPIPTSLAAGVHRRFWAIYGRVAMSIAAVVWFWQVDVESLKVEGSVQPTLVSRRESPPVVAEHFPS